MRRLIALTQHKALTEKDLHQAFKITVVSFFKINPERREILELFLGEPPGRGSSGRLGVCVLGDFGLDQDSCAVRASDPVLLGAGQVFDVFTRLVLRAGRPCRISTSTSSAAAISAA